MKTPKLTLDIARQFSREPAGRYVKDGLHSGEVFREKLLRPAFDKAEIVEVVLDGTEGYGSSFLEEAFGGLVRKGLPAAEVLRRLAFVSMEDPTLVDEIREYVQQQGDRVA